MPTDPASVLIADPDPESCAKIAALLAGVPLVGQIARTGADVLRIAETERPALFLLAVDLEEPCGFELIHQLRVRFGAHSPIVAVAASRGGVPRDEIAALLVGASDFLTKPIRSDRLLVRVRRLVSSHISGPRPGAGLTRREQEVLVLLTYGMRRAEIAQQLCITSKTAATHIERILGKLGAHTQAQAVGLALREGIVEPQRRAASDRAAALSSSW
jgi:DNA-binding NarL/FixJ family response regulator